ncbi:MAG TPA: GDP-mannose 4,6-dehydratase [Thermoplasmata archaeon]|nr:GDP-mannose 4,6-dehydratase [Thermoplasmata archaeon]
MTGGTGFLGSYLSELLRGEGHEITRTYVVDPDPFLARKGPEDRIVHLDVSNKEEVERVLDTSRPEVIYHFAGQPYVKPSWEDPPGTFRTNIDGTIYLLEWLRRKSPRTQFAFAGSGASYGVAARQPITEDTPLRPSSPYASSKAAGDVLCFQYCSSFEIPTYRYRIFGTTGPGKVGDAPNDFASQVARLEAGPAPRTIRVGNIDTLRDVTDVRDSVRAMVRIVERGTPGEPYNVGSGEARSVRGILDALRSIAHAPIEVVQDEARMRRVDEPVIQADVTRLRALGWSPAIPWPTTIADLLTHWRSKHAPSSVPADRAS